MVNKKKHLIITERHDTEEMGLLPTTQARKSLYNLIAMFRKDAALSDDAQTSGLFTYAADTIARLARLFRAFEDVSDPTEPSVVNKMRDN